ncbi:hypothetical protein MPSEU_001002700 [Mayamaea pseudoterrestris]|nr:hypothetical protein MPSEU_001002700 [Mayamaea pseudoterrestris]
MPVLSVPETPSNFEASPFKKAAPFVISMNASDLPLASPLLTHAESLEMDTFGQPMSVIKEVTASPRPKLRAYQEHMESMSPRKESKPHVPIDTQAIIAKYHEEHDLQNVVNIPVGLLGGGSSNKKKIHHRHRQQYPDSSDDEFDWTESNYEDPLDHDASANGYENFGQPIMEVLPTASPKRKMQVYLKDHGATHASQDINPIGNGEQQATPPSVMDLDASENRDAEDVSEADMEELMMQGG